VSDIKKEFRIFNRQLKQKTDPFNVYYNPSKSSDERLELANRNKGSRVGWMDRVPAKDDAYY
jgi:hypothetical protein